MAEAKKVVLKLRGSDGSEYELKEKAAEQSEFFRRQLKFVLHDCDPEAIRITIPDTTGSTLAKVVEYCKKHSEIASQFDLGNWDAAFINVEISTLCDLIKAADILGIDSLAVLALNKLSKAGKMWKENLWKF